MRCRLTRGSTAHDVEEQAVEDEDAAVPERLDADEAESFTTAIDISDGKGHVEKSEREVDCAESP